MSNNHCKKIRELKFGALTKGKHSKHQLVLYQVKFSLCFVILFQEDKIPKSDIEETKLNTNDTTVAIKIGNPVKNYQREVISFVTSSIGR